MPFHTSVEESWKRWYLNILRLNPPTGQLMRNEKIPLFFLIFVDGGHWVVGIQSSCSVPEGYCFPCGAYRVCVTNVSVDGWYQQREGLSNRVWTFCYDKIGKVSLNIYVSYNMFHIQWKVHCCPVKLYYLSKFGKINLNRRTFSSLDNIFLYTSLYNILVSKTLGKHCPWFLEN